MTLLVCADTVESPLAPDMAAVVTQSLEVIVILDDWPDIATVAALGQSHLSAHLSGHLQSIRSRTNRNASSTTVNRPKPARNAVE